MVSNPSYSNPINYAQISAGITGFGSVFANYSSSMAQAGSYEAQALSYTAKARGLKTDQKKAKLAGKQTALQLNSYFNESMANQVVMSAAQGRRGGSAQAVGEAATAQYNWDLDYTELATQVEISGLKAEELSATRAASIAKRAAQAERSAAGRGATLGLLGTATSIAGIG